MPAWLSGSDSELNEQRLSPGGRWQGAAARVLRSCEAPSWHFGEKSTDLEGSPAPAPLCLQSRARGPPACWGRSSLARRQQQVAMKAVRKCRAGAGGAHGARDHPAGGGAGAEEQTTCCSKRIQKQSTGHREQRLHPAACSKKSRGEKLRLSA